MSKPTAPTSEPTTSAIPATTELKKVDHLDAAGHVHGPGCSHHHMEPFVRTAPKIGRNDPCSCGSGKKAKKCCLSAS